MSKGSKLKMLEFNSKPSELETAMREMAENLPFLIQSSSIAAKMLKAKYDNLIAEGFNEQQAMEIVKNRPLYE